MIPPCVMLVILDENGKLKLYLRMIIYFMTATFFAVGLGLNFTDDGLRHLAFANSGNIMQSWGNVYPMSLFGTVGNYDPWSFWDSFLSFIISISSFEHAHIVVNLISLFILMTLMDLIFSIELRRYKNSILLMTVILMTFVSARYVNLRPDLLSGFFVMSIYIITNLKNKKLKTLLYFVASILYTPMYYLFFVYTLAMAMFMFMIRDYKSMLVFVVSTLFGFLYYYYSFGVESLEIIKYVLHDEQLRDGLNVAEGVPLFSVLQLLDMRIIISIYLLTMLIIKFFKQELLVKNKLFSLVLTLSLLWVGQMRYEELFQPLIYILIITSLLNLQKNNLKKACNVAIDYYTRFHKEFSKSNKNVSFIVIFSIFLAFEFGVNANMHRAPQNEKSESIIKYLKSKDFNNKTILFNSLSDINYYSIYANPSVKVIPSCSIGWVNGSKRIKELYKKLITKNIKLVELEELAHATHANYMVLQLPINRNVEINLNAKHEKSLNMLKIFDKYIVISLDNN